MADRRRDVVLRRIAWSFPRLAGKALRRRGFHPMARSASEADGTEASRIVGRALSSNGGKRYLEVGIKKGATLNAVEAATVVGVDPFHWVDVSTCRPGMTVVPLPSDAYFDGLSGDERFDVVFVDGLHVFRQAYRDVLNAASVLAPGGAILIDDVVPTTAAAAHPSKAVSRSLDPSSQDWMGDVYKVVIALERHHPEIEVRIIADSRGYRLGLAWLRSEPWRGTHASDAQLDAVDALAFEDVFTEGSAERHLFDVTDEDAAFAAYAESIRPSR